MDTGRERRERREGGCVVLARRWLEEVARRRSGVYGPVQYSVALGRCSSQYSQYSSVGRQRVSVAVVVLTVPTSTEAGS